MSTTKTLYPCKFIGITSGYKTASRPTHSGIDLGWNRNYGGPNHEIIAPFDGIVTDIKTNVADGTGTSYGNYILLQSINDASLSILVAHLKHNSFKVKKGDQVSQGSVMALMGNTGAATGVHCHYEVRKSGAKVNPVLYTYATNDMTIAKSTMDNYKILETSESKYLDISGVARNETLNQLQVIISNLRVRKSPTVSENNQVGWAVVNAYYTFTDSITKDGYTWYEIGKDEWIAYKDTWVKIYPKTSSTSDLATQLQKEIKELEKQRDQLANDIIALKTENESLNLQLQNESFVKFEYNVSENSNYKIWLNKGETLLIK